MLILRLEGVRPTRAETSALGLLEDDLDRQLLVRSPTEPYFGSYREQDQQDGVVRLFLSAPDAERLFNHLSDWLASLPWPGGAAAVLRAGPLRDPTAPERRIELG